MSGTPASPGPTPTAVVPPRNRAAENTAWVLLAAGSAFGGLGISAIAGLGPVYGPATGRWLDGVAWAFSMSLALFFFGIISPLLIATPFVLSRRGPSRIVAAICLVALVVGIALAGISAVGAKYEAAPKQPSCPLADSRVRDALDELDHVGPMDTLVETIDGCETVLRSVSLAEAVEYYTAQLDKLGWTIEDLDGGGIDASRDGVLFTLSGACGSEPVMTVRTDTSGLEPGATCTGIAG
jgi:hypothetical protein